MSYEYVMAGALTFCLILASYLAFFKKEKAHKKPTSNKQ